MEAADVMVKIRTKSLKLQKQISVFKNAIFWMLKKHFVDFK